MYNTATLNDISIEQFAAFLDGNLPEDDMQSVSSIIDADKEYSDILGDVMHIDDTVDTYTSMPDAYADEIPDMDFDLPLIPVTSVAAEDTVELHFANAPESDNVEIHCANAASITPHDNLGNDDDPLLCSYTEPQTSVCDDAYDIDQHTDNDIDFTDLA